MKKLIGLLAFTTIFISCGKDTEEFLYNKYDEDYGRVQAMYSEKCENETPIFAELQKTNLFDTFLTDARPMRAFKIVRKLTIDKNNPVDITTHIIFKQNSFDPTAVMDVFVSSNDNHQDATEKTDYQFAYKREDNSKLLATIVTGTCSTDKKLGVPTFAASWMKYNPNREQKLDANNFSKASETVIVRTGYPIILSRYEQKESLHTKEPGKEKKWSYAIGSISEYDTMQKCDEDAICRNVIDRASSQTCSLDVNDNFHNSSDPLDKLSKFEGCLKK
jgi:hypothetical protein